MNIWDEIIKAGELQKLKKEAKAEHGSNRQTKANL